MNQLRRSIVSAIPTFLFAGGISKLVAGENHKLLGSGVAAEVASFRSNSELRNILQGWEGTPVDHSGKFMNHEHLHNNSIWRVIDWQTAPSTARRDKKADPFHLRVVRDDSFLKRDDDCLVWFGHASFFLRLGGVSFFTDPVFGNIFMRDRLCSLPVSPEYIRDLDFVLLSHVHADHADEASLRYLQKRNAQSQYLCGLGAGDVIRDLNGAQHIQEAGWYQQYDTTKLSGGRAVEVFYLPARHWSRRGIFDENASLWGSYVIRTKDKTIFWGGDSGYGSQFAMVKQLFGTIDWAIVGAGAYKPEWFMGQNHTSPKGAIQAAEDMGARNFIPMHYATFDLADEAPGDPVRELENIRAEGRCATQIHIPNVGEIVKL